MNDKKFTLDEIISSYCNSHHDMTNSTKLRFYPCGLLYDGIFYLGWNSGMIPKASMIVNVHSVTDPIDIIIAGIKYRGFVNASILGKFKFFSRKRAFEKEYGETEISIGNENEYDIATSLAFISILSSGGVSTRFNSMQLFSLLSYVCESQLFYKIDMKTQFAGFTDVISFNFAVTQQSTIQSRLFEYLCDGYDVYEFLLYVTNYFKSRCWTLIDEFKKNEFVRSVLYRLFITGKVAIYCKELIDDNVEKNSSGYKIKKINYDEFKLQYETNHLIFEELLTSSQINPMLEKSDGRLNRYEFKKSIADKLSCITCHYNIRNPKQNVKIIVINESDKLKVLNSLGKNNYECIVDPEYDMFNITLL